MRRHHFAVLHRYLGLTTAVFLFVAGLGGAVAAFQQELDTWLNPRLFLAQGSGLALSVSALAVHIEAADPRAEVSYLLPAPAPGRTVIAYVQPREEGDALGYDQLGLDPSSGTIQDLRLWGACCFERQNIVPFLYRLHYSLALPGAWGQWVLGCTAMAWLLDCFVGLYLTFPRKLPFWVKWRKRWLVRTSAGTGRAIFDGHNAAGLWCWVLLLILALSSVEMNLDSDVFRPVVGAVTALRTVPDRPARANAARLVGWDEALNLGHAEAAARGWPVQAQWMSWQRGENAYHIGFDRRDPDTRDDATRHELRIGADDRSIVALRDPKLRTVGDLFIDLQYPLHTGRLLGLPGRLLICIAGLATAILSATGVWLWLRRQWRWQANPQPRREPLALFKNGPAT